MYISVSMHVRRGDACDMEVDEDVDLEQQLLLKFVRQKQFILPSRPCYSIDAYIKKLHHLRNLYKVKRVYLSTDSTEMIKRIHSEPLFNWVYVHNPHLSSLDRKGWIEKRPDSENEGILNSTLADINLLRYGDIFLGAFSSQYSKIGYFLMAGEQQTIPPFLSLDVPLACAIHFNCSMAVLSHVNYSVMEVLQLDDVRRKDGIGPYGGITIRS
jgi:hypothetical protein